MTTLVTVAILVHNVNELVKEWLRTEQHVGSLMDRRETCDIELRSVKTLPG
ncbi:hypothetical protein BDK88_1467 [Natrinema hispanicum]|uniref:Uncharacterized protein n=1 Tax=Natrinema hispanicum TaxID=392421 RepID=A0A482Y642_9EURY|nr:hypothetical protein [Natrinema hispanicum]RZV10314.1 hypothetical protein BDK88_1467 [Natrinema hispanicum]